MYFKKVVITINKIINFNFFLKIYYFQVIYIMGKKINFTLEQSVFIQEAIQSIIDNGGNLKKELPTKFYEQYSLKMGYTTLKNEFDKSMQCGEFTNDESNFIVDEFEKKIIKTPHQKNEFMETFFLKFHRKINFVSLQNHFKRRKEIFNSQLTKEISGLSIDDDTASNGKCLKSFRIN